MSKLTKLDVIRAIKYGMVEALRGLDEDPAQLDESLARARAELIWAEDLIDRVTEKERAGGKAE